MGSAAQQQSRTFERLTKLDLAVFHLVLLQLVCTGNCRLELHYKDFTDISSISLQQKSVTKSPSEPIIMLLPDPDPSLRTDDNQTMESWSGWMMYKEPIPFLAGSGSSLQSPYLAQSFNTSFTFRLITNATTQNSPSGMTFFITTNGGSPSGSQGGYFGLADLTTVDPATNPFFAVEFDTHKSEEPTNDPSSSHIGIDISSFSSANLTDTSNNNTNKNYPELYLYSGYKFTCWISYNASSYITKVWMTNQTAEFANNITPPENKLQPILQLKYNLYSVFSVQNNMFVGFSAATNSDSDMLGVEIYSWHFSIDDTNTSSNEPNIITITQESASRYVKIIIPLAIIAIVSIASALAIALYCQRRISKHSPSSTSSSTSHKSMLQNSKTSCIYSIIRCFSSSAPNLNEARDRNNDMNYTTTVNLPRYSYQELELSTNGFHRNTLIGEGGFSKVHRGTLHDGSVVAIKRLKDGVRKEAEFSAELKMINSIRHRNLLQLQGWSYENGEALLVYKFISNGSLNTYLFGEERGTLDSGTRLRILSGVAAALEYLHFGLGDCVLHRDVKAANVLLTENFEPVLGDFGLARLIKHNESVTTTMVGTVGYVAPEVVLMGKVTDKADVYNFGVLMLEVATGCKALRKGPLKVNEQVYLVEQVSQLEKSNSINEAIDPFIIQLEASQLASSHIVGKVKEQWVRVLHLGLLCCHQNPESRPNMRYVNQEIHNIILGVQSFPSPIVGENTNPEAPLNPSSTVISTDRSWTTSSSTLSTSDLLVHPR